MSYIGAEPGEHPRKTIANDMKLDHPNVSMLGYSNKVYSADNWFGIEFGINFDVGLNWEVPLYNENQNLVSRIRTSALAGGRQYVTIQIWYLKIHVFFDVLPVRCTFFDFYMKANIVEYSDFCAAARWSLDVTRFMLFFQIDVNECLFGLVGAFTGSTMDCNWSTYYINHPIWDYAATIEQMSGEIFPNTCEDEFLVYN